MTEYVKSFTTEQIRADLTPIHLVHTVGTRGTRKTSECKWNTKAAAQRHGQQLVGRVMS